MFKNFISLKIKNAAQWCFQFFLITSVRPQSWHYNLRLNWLIPPAAYTAIMTTSISSPLVFSFSPQQQEALPTLASMGRRREGPLSTTERKSCSHDCMRAAVVSGDLYKYPLKKVETKSMETRKYLPPQILRVKKFVHFTIISASLPHPPLYSAAKRHFKNFRPFFSKKKVI